MRGGAMPRRLHLRTCRSCLPAALAASDAHAYVPCAICELTGGTGQVPPGSIAGRVAIGHRRPVAGHHHPPATVYRPPATGYRLSDGDYRPATGDRRGPQFAGNEMANVEPTPARLCTVMRPPISWARDCDNAS